MAILERLETARRELLDMGLRANPMLAIPRTSRFLAFVPCDSAAVFGQLVEANRRLSFQALGEPDGDLEPGGDDAHDDGWVPAEEGRVAEGSGLAVELSPERLDLSLIKLESEAHTLLQEQGIDALYLAMGVLEWYEDENASTPRLAPLVLVPVELQRESSRSQFRLVYTGAELGPNLTLQAKMRGEFRVEIPDFPEEFSFAPYLDAVEQVIESQPRWQLHRDGMLLGLFSYSRFLMYADLDSTSWPQEAPLGSNPQLGRLLEAGYQQDADRLGTIEGDPRLGQPEVLNLVKDADSTQMQAILAVCEGSNLVIQGPPGTGKSQTITNLIAEAVGRGQKVLFVAQKIAALNVVKERLDSCSLGDAVLELHSHKSNKRAVLGSLQQALGQGRPTVPDRSGELRRLQAARDALDNYVRAIQTPIRSSGLDFPTCLGRLLALEEDARLTELGRIPFAQLANWDAEALREAENALQAAADFITEFGLPSTSPFHGSRRTALSPTQAADLRRQVERAAADLAQLRQQASDLAETMQLPVPTRFSEIATIHRAGRRALEAPHLEGVRVSTQDWQARRDEIREAIACGSEMAGIRETLSPLYIDAVFEADLLPVRMGLAGRADKWWRMLSGPYRQAKATLQGFARGELKGAATEWLEQVDSLLIYRERRQRLGLLEPTCEKLFGAQWQGERSDWSVLAWLVDWIIGLYESIGRGELPESLTDFLEGAPDLSQFAPALESLQDQAGTTQSEIRALLESLQWDPEVNEDSLGLAGWADHLDGWGDVEQLYALVRFNQIAARLRVAGLEPQLREVRQWRKAPDLLQSWLLLSYYSGLVDSAYAERPEIGEFDHLSHARRIEEFARLDAQLETFAQEALVLQHHAALPARNAPGEMDVLRTEFNKSRRHKPIRRLIREAGTVIQQIKPVFMMSPMSVATYLPQGAISFDLVIFDEASQIPAPESLGAIARGRQLVVVGDSKQMPPTNFFQKALELDDEEAEQSVVADIESLLGLGLARGMPERMLRWHYRSRHHSLIAVSNDQFYDHQLVVFPTSGANAQATGLRLHYLPHTQYDRGRSRTNPAEAQAVAEAAIEHARTRGQLSLGIVAFSTAQREAILIRIEALLRDHPEVEEFFRHRDQSEEFFVRNLENVQGDERDVIFISVGYGKTASGQLAKNFGPLNTQGGERRLNVLITRARLAMEVFANFTDEDLSVGDGAPFGVRAFKTFLHHARTGTLPERAETNRETESPFEDAVKRAIESLGYSVEPQVGSQGFYIDLAVRDPGKPGRYILAVECDGASYHSSATARDRDRLRQSVLEGLGWRFHRIWSTEWFRHPVRETERLGQAIEQAIADQRRQDASASHPGHPPPRPKVVVSEPDIQREDDAEDDLPAAEAYCTTPLVELGFRASDSNFAEIPVNRIVKAIRAIAEREGPIHTDLLTRRLLEAAGIKRAGARIQKAIENGCAVGGRNGDLLLDLPFVDAPGRVERTGLRLRDWSAITGNGIGIEHLPMEERAHSIFLQIQAGYAVDADSAMAAAARLLGFQRVTSRAREYLEPAVDHLEKSGLIEQDSDRYRLTAEARQQGIGGLAGTLSTKS